MTNFDRLTSSPKALAAALQTLDGSLDSLYCDGSCGDIDRCPHELQCIINWLNWPEGNEKS
jgi:hypothetical protein